MLFLSVSRTLVNFSQKMIIKQIVINVFCTRRITCKTTCTVVSVPDFPRQNARRHNRSSFYSVTALLEKLCQCFAITRKFSKGNCYAIYLIMKLFKKKDKKEVEMYFWFLFKKNSVLNICIAKHLIEICLLI